MALKRLFDLLSSLRLTIVCLGFATLLVFVGTMAQVDLGLYAAQAKYFRSLFVYWTLPGTNLKLPVLPGGYLTGGLLVVNLICAQARTLGFTLEKLGLLMVHAGLVLLLLGQLSTDFFQVESTMRLAEGETKNYSEDFRANELVVIDQTDPGYDEVVAIPEPVLVSQKEIRHEKLPFAIKLINYWPNSDLFGAPTNGTVTLAVNRGVGSQVHVLPKPSTSSTDERNLPSAVIELVSPKGSLGTWLVSAVLAAKQTVTNENRTYQLALRLTRYYEPHSLTLIEARHDVYPGTDIPKNFSSRVRIVQPGTGENREVLIYMNNPLRYGGQTYYQYQMAAQTAEKSSTLQVVRNPGWLTPYLSCALVGLGLLWQFLWHLVSFVRQRRA